MTNSNRFNVCVAHTYKDGEGNDKTNFTRVGAAFVNSRQDGSQVFNIKLDFPVGAQELVLFEPKSKEDDDNVTD